MIGLNDAYANGSPETAPPFDVAAWVEQIFCPDGLLQKRLQLDYRQEQASMAAATQSAWDGDEALFFEAGTGVGKSLAYLIPGILHAMTRERPFVISTHTIALQEQIEQKDLPLCRKVFASVEDLVAFSGFKHAVLLGRGNYLCGARLAQALKSKKELFPSDEQIELARIEAWARSTETGLLQELNPAPLPEVWDWVQADGHACNSRNCSPKTCFLRKAREAVRQANVIVVNHSLLFLLLAAGHFPKGDIPGILFPEDFMTLDEAHTLPAVATEYFGLQLSAFGLRRLLLKLYHPHKRKARGLLAKQGALSLKHQVTELTLASDHFFQGLYERFLSGGRPLRLQQPGWAENLLDEPMRDLVHGLRG